MARAKCDDTLVAAYVADELSLQEMEEVAAHIEACPSCQGLERNLRLLPGLFQQVADEAWDEGVDRSFEAARAKALEGQRSPVPTALPPASDQGVWSRILQGWRHLGTSRSRWLPAMGAAGLGLLLWAGLWQAGHDSMSRDGQNYALTQLVEPEGPFSEKGAALVAETPTLSLSFSVQSSPEEVSRGRNGWRYGQEAVLYFRCSLPGEGYVLLTRVGNDGLEALTPAGQGLRGSYVGGGDWDLAENGHLLGFPLRGLSGTQRFVALFSPAPFELTPALRRALMEGALAPEVAPGRRLESDIFSVVVEP